jgi:hypothetical protein
MNYWMLAIGLACVAGAFVPLALPRRSLIEQRAARMRRARRKRKKREFAKSHARVVAQHYARTHNRPWPPK